MRIRQIITYKRNKLGDLEPSIKKEKIERDLRNSIKRHKKEMRQMNKMRKRDKELKNKKGYQPYV